MNRANNNTSQVLSGMSKVMHLELKIITHYDDKDLMHKCLYFLKLLMYFIAKIEIIWKYVL